MSQWKWDCFLVIFHHCEKEWMRGDWDYFCNYCNQWLFNPSELSVLFSAFLDNWTSRISKHSWKTTKSPLSTKCNIITASLFYGQLHSSLWLSFSKYIHCGLSGDEGTECLIVISQDTFILDAFRNIKVKTNKVRNHPKCRILIFTVWQSQSEFVRNKLPNKESIFSPSFQW